MKAFKMHWLDGTTEITIANSIQEAFKELGITAGAGKGIDYYEEVKELPFGDKFVIIDGNIVYYKELVEEIKIAILVRSEEAYVGQEFSVSMHSRKWNLRIISIEEAFICLEKII